MVFRWSFLALLPLFAVGDAYREASSEEFPFQVSVQNSNSRHLCGGAIITEKWVLTASSCVKLQDSVIVGYGSADSNNPVDSITSEKIERQNLLSLRGKSSLALIRLQRPIQFSKTAQQAKLPTAKVQLRNTTKLSGWQLGPPHVDLPPNLHVCDTYLVVPKDCRRITGTLVTLAHDEFCGMDEDHQNLLTNPGSIVSKSAIVLGILADIPLAPSEPLIYIKMSEHEQWVRDVLQQDAQYVNWVDNVPKDSAPQQHAMSLILLGISATFLRVL